MSERSSKPQLEVACTLSEERQAERRKKLLGGIVQRIQRVRELSDGYAFGFDLTSGNEVCVRDFVDFESRCCGFAQYEIERDEAERTVWLIVRGPAGTKEFAGQLIPPSVAVEAMQASEAGGNGGLLRAGIAGASAALIGIVCCATPFLAVGLGIIGLGGAVASASLWLDAIAAPLLFFSLLAFGVALWRRRRARRVSVFLRAEAQRAESQLNSATAR